MMLLMSQASFAHAIIGESIIYKGGGKGIISVTKKLRHTSIDAIYTDVSNSFTFKIY